MEISDVVVVRGIGTVVPAVRLTWRLQVPAGTAAVPVVPSPLVDGVAVATAGVWQIGHIGPQENGRASSIAEVELNEVNLAVRVRGRVGTVKIHPAVAAHHFAVVLGIHAKFQPFTEGVVVTCDGTP